MVNKKIVIIVTIIATILVAGIVYFSLVRESQKQYTFAEQNVENQVENDVENNLNVEQNSIKEDVSEEDKKEETPKLDGKDKAIELAKKQWGEDDDTVYYYVEEQVSDNIYIISVRDQETTQDLSTYKVNINKESVEED